MTFHTLAHALGTDATDRAGQSRCTCTAAERSRHCVICGRDGEFFVVGTEPGADTCSKRCWRTLLELQRQERARAD